MLVARCLCAFAALLLTSNQSSAKGGNVRSEDRYNPEHIQGLPSKIRNAIMQRCRTPRALHAFWDYHDGPKGIVLHFEHFYCEGGGTVCGPSGCLHQVYVVRNGRYILLRSYYAPPGE
jgi:hypothetical protein